MNVPLRLLPTNSVVETVIDGVRVYGTVGEYEHYWTDQYTFPVQFGAVFRTMTIDSCTVLHLAPYATGPRCLLDHCDQHGNATEVAADTTVVPYPRRRGRYGHAASLAAPPVAVAG